MEMTHNLCSPGALLLSDSVSCSLPPSEAGIERASGKEQRWRLMLPPLGNSQPFMKGVSAAPNRDDDEQTQGIAFSTARLSLSSSLNERSNFL